MFSKVIYFYKSRMDVYQGKWFKCKDEEDCMGMVKLGFEVKKVVVEPHKPDPDFDINKDWADV